MAMRKVLYGPEGIMLSHIMKLYDKHSLLNYASDLQIRRVSGLKKDEFDDALSLCEKDYAFMNKEDKINVPVDVAKAYKKLNTPDFRQYAKKMSWLAQCLYFGENFYGVFAKDILLEMYNTRKGYRISYEELERMCNEFPDDLTECQ